MAKSASSRRAGRVALKNRTFEEVMNTDLEADWWDLQDMGPQMKNGPRFKTVQETIEHSQRMRAEYAAAVGR